MHTTLCLEVIVKFVRADKHGQAIRTTNGDSRTQYLKIEHDAVRLHIAFMDRDDTEVGSINFNSAEVLEYTAIGWKRAPEKVAQ